MRIRTVILLVLSLLPSAGIGQSLTVRSGEHEGFSRLVVPLPSGSDWTLQQEGRDVALTISGSDARLDTSAVFDLIPRDRISQVTTEPGRLLIELSCECRVAAFPIQDRFAVLDVASPGVGLPAPFIPLETPDEEQKPTIVAAPEAVALPTITEQDTTSLLPDLVPLSLPNLARKPLSELEQQTLNTLQKQLAQEVGTAATRGLLDPVPNTGLPRPDVPVADPALSEAQRDAGRGDNHRATTPNNMRITSGMEVDGRAKPTGAAQSLSGFDCPQDAEVDIASWSQGKPFQELVGPAYASLFDALDHLDIATATNLAHLYLHYGFGAEALQIINLDPSGIMEKEWWLGDIAQIMEFGVASEDSILPSLMDCETDIALWAMLSREHLETSGTVDPAAALRALDKLPLHLRKFLAPALSHRFLTYGDRDAAAAALRNLERVPGDLPTPGKLAQARIKLEEGEAAEAVEGLEDVIDDNAAQSPEALIALVETQLNAGKPLTSETALLIEAYAKELRDSELGPDLQRAHVLALAKSGQFDAAFAELEKTVERSDEDSRSELRERLFAEMSQSAPDVVFLEYIMQQDGDTLADLPQKVKLAVADRVLGLGFPDVAEGVVDDIPLRPRNEERQLLAARIALALSQPQRAQAALMDMSGPEVPRLMAEAKQMAGEFAEASAFFEKADMAVQSADAAWLGDRAAQETLADDPRYGPVLALADDATPAVNEIEGMLARSSQALEESLNARETLTQFLQETSIGSAGSE